MKKSPLISIVLPSYNHEKYLLESISSIISCGLLDLEVLICDDCSTDASFARCLEGASLLKDFKVSTSVIKNRKNLGVSETIKNLIAQAQGEFIFPLASDDLFLPNGIKNRIDTFTQNLKTKLVISDCMAIGSKSEILCQSFAQKNNFSPQDFIHDNIAATLSTRWDYPLNIQCWKRDFFKVHGGMYEFEPFVFCEDLPAALWAGSRDEIGFCPVPCIAYRCRAWPQLSDGCPFSKWKDMAFIYKKYSLLYSQPYKDIMRLIGEKYFFLSIGEKQLAEARGQEALALSMGV